MPPPAPPGPDTDSTIHESTLTAATPLPSENEDPVSSTLKTLPATKPGTASPSPPPATEPTNVKRQTLQFPSPSPQPTVIEGNQQPTKKGLSTGGIVGLTIGALIAVVLIFGIIAAGLC